MLLDARIPSGPIENVWDKCRFEMKLVNPANKRNHEIIVVGSGLAGASAAAEFEQAALERHFSPHGHRHLGAGLPGYGEDHRHGIARGHSVWHHSVHLVESREARCQPGESDSGFHSADGDR